MVVQTVKSELHFPVYKAVLVYVWPQSDKHPLETVQLTDEKNTVQPKLGAHDESWRTESAAEILW